MTDVALDDLVAIGSDQPYSFAPAKQTGTAVDSPIDRQMIDLGNFGAQRTVERVVISGDSIVFEYAAARGATNALRGRAVGKRYPRWLNFMSLLSIFLVFVGIIVAIFVAPVGAFLAFVGFSGIYLFGSIAEKRDGRKMG